MKKRLYESGSAQVAIFVALILTLVCALGFIFWQNFIQVKSDDTPTRAVQSTNDRSRQAVETRTIALGRWGMSVPLQKDDPNYIAKYEKTNHGETYLFGVENEKFCEDTSFVGVIERNKLSDVITEDNFRGDTSYIGKTWEEFYDGAEGVMRIDGYVYVYSGPQSMCSEADTDNEKREIYVVTTLKARVEKLKPLE